MFLWFLLYVAQEIISNTLQKYGNKLVDMYEEHYRRIWGDDEEINVYISQSLIRKMQNKFGERLNVSNMSNREGSFIYLSGMKFDEAKSL